MNSAEFIAELRALEAEVRGDGPKGYGSDPPYGPGEVFSTRASAGDPGDNPNMFLCQEVGELIVRAFDSGLFKDKQYGDLHDVLRPVVREYHLSGSAVEVTVAVVDWLREQGCEVNEPDPTYGPIERMARRFQWMSDLPFSEMGQVRAKLLKAMVDLGATSRESHKRGADIAAKAVVDEDIAKPHLAALAKGGLAGSVTGKKGGSWIMPAGVEALERWKRLGRPL